MVILLKYRCKDRSLITRLQISAFLILYGFSNFPGINIFPSALIRVVVRVQLTVGVH